MRFKPVPPAPESLAFVREAQRAVPLVPGTEDDCCARLMSRTDVGRRDEARTWITFLRALELAEETDSGFVRTRRDPDPEALGRAFRERVYGAEELLDVLRESGPVSTDDAFERFADRVTPWERGKDPGGWRTTWRSRVERLLDWAVLLGLAERTTEGYRAT